MPNNRIFIIGGGPAGMMAAIRAVQLGADVAIVEKNDSLGRKLLLTGNGRCNLTNTCNLEKFIGNFLSGGQFLRDAFKALSNRDLIRFFEEEGLQFKVEEGGRVFPATERSSSVLQALDRKLQGPGINILLETALVDVEVKKGRVSGAILSGTGPVFCDGLIIATGGLSYSSTGSTGDGFRIAAKLGHKVVPPRPGLVPLESGSGFVRSLEGLALKDVRLTFRGGKKRIVFEKGDLIFTASGISGPSVLSASSKVADWLAEGLEVHLEIDLEPGRSAPETDAFLLKHLGADSNRNIKNIIKNIYPERLVDVILGLAGIDPSKKANQITHEERALAGNMLKNFKVDIKRTRPIEEAMITRGGVHLKEIDPRTMGSRLVKGLYFAGEVIDVDGDTGGFNLQAAFSTGYLAGQSAAKWE